MALRNLGIEHEVVAIAEIDRFAIDSYTAIHGDTLNLGDISQIKTEDIPDHDLFTYSFPCFTADTLISTETGLKELIDVEIGEKVVTHTGQLKEVKNFFNNGKHQVFSVKTMGADEIKATGNHKFYVREKSRVWDKGKNLRRFSNPVWKEVSQLTTADYTGFPVITDEKYFIWKGIDKKKNWGHSTHEDTLSPFLNREDFWWLWGRYVADGWKRKGGIVFAVGNSKVAEFEKSIPSEFNYSVAQETGCVKYHFTGQELNKFSEIFGNGAKNKDIPIAVLELPVNLLKAFVEGYIAGDGYRVGNLIKASSVSRKLVYSLQQAIAKVYKRPSSIYKTSVKGTYTIEGREVNQSDIYQITFKEMAGKQDKAFYEDGYIWCPVNSVIPLGVEPVYDIEVADDHSFLAQNTIVHNCQDISVAGKQSGLDENSGTRSGLLWECQKVISVKRPKYLLLENVKNLVGKRHKENFDKWLQWLEEQGYSNYWQVLNAKDYGVPQNRERVFVVSILGEHEPYNFPGKQELQLRLKDLLEDEVEEKFYLSDEYLERLVVSMNDEKYPFGNAYSVIGSTVGEGKGTNSRHWVYDTDSNISTLDATMYKQPKQVLIKNATKQGYLEATEVDGIALAYPNSNTRRGRVQKGISQTLQTADSVGTLHDFRIRKLTPLECWRLMGFTDTDFLKAQLVNSNSQLYKQAGNSIVVPVLEGIFRKMFIQEVQ